MSANPEPKLLAFCLPDMGGGGAERVALTLIKHFVSQGHKVDLVLARAEGELLPLLPPEVRIIDLKARRLRHALSGLWRYLRREKPDALQVSMWPLTVIGIIAHRLAGSRARLVISEHTMLSNHYPGRARRAVIRLTSALFYPGADARIAVSQGVADDLASLAGLEGSSIEIVPNPVDVPPSIASSPAVEKLWAGATARILTVGRLTAEKNQALLVEAFARLPGKMNARLMIVGGGPLEAELRRRARESGVEPKVTFAGFVIDPWPFYATADLFVLCSDYEGYPVALVEALHAGLRVVSTDCDSGPRVILDGGRFGRLVPVGDVEGLAGAISEALAATPDPSGAQRRAQQLERNSLGQYEKLLLGER